jgi:SPP1 family predicted phage head-tail adaptor
MAIPNRFTQVDPLAIDPGELRHKIQIQQASSTRDAAGQPVSTWNVVLTTWAKIAAPGSMTYKERFANNTFSSQSSDFITIRWPGASITIEPGMRVIFGDNIYLIQAVDNVLHRNRKVNLACIQIDEDSN